MVVIYVAVAEPRHVRPADGTYAPLGFEKAGERIDGQAVPTKIFPSDRLGRLLPALRVNQQIDGVAPPGTAARGLIALGGENRRDLAQTQPVGVKL